MKKLLETLKICAALMLALCISLSLAGVCRAETVSAATENAATVNAVKGKTILILGDSRTCSIVNLMMNDSSYEKLYFNLEDAKVDAVFKKGDTNFVICSQGGGGCMDGALRAAKDRMLGIVANNPALLCVKETYLFNLFGINDADRNVYATVNGYSAVNGELQRKIPGLVGMFQFNIGPITEDGYIAEVGLSNEKIVRFNDVFRKIRYATPIDLYSYLIESGFDTIDDTELYGVKTGIHYTDETTGKILKLIISVSEL